MTMETTKPDWLIEHSEQIENGQTVLVSYDREGDTLEIFFNPGPGTGVELTDHFVLRYDKKTAAPLSLIFLSFSKLTQPTEYGPESFRLTGLEKLPPKQRDTITQILMSPPVSYYLRTSALSLPRHSRHVPITYLRQPLATAL
jgi:hypothetical protein